MNKRAIAYARGLTADQLLAKLDGQHPCALAQSLGISGRGSAREVAAQIVRQLPRIERMYA